MFSGGDPGHLAQCPVTRVRCNCLTQMKTERAAYPRICATWADLVVDSDLGLERLTGWGPPSRSRPNQAEVRDTCSSDQSEVA